MAIFLTFHHYSLLHPYLSYSLCSFFSSLFSYLFFYLSFSSLFLPLWALSPWVQADWTDFDCVMYLNRHAEWEKPLLLTTGRSQRADIGVSFCEWDLARAFRSDSWPSVLASSLLSSHTHIRTSICSTAISPDSHFFTDFRYRGTCVTDIKVRIKHLLCNHLFMVEWKLLDIIFHPYFCRVLLLSLPFCIPVLCSL